jgi:hypothetical protein
LMLELGFAALTFEIIQVPDCDQLPCGKFMTTTIDMPVVKLAGIGALDGIAHVLEWAGEEWVGLSEFRQRPIQGAEQLTIEILPVWLAAHCQVGGALDRIVVLGGLADTPGVLIYGIAFEAIDHFSADIERQRGGFFEDKAAGFNFTDGFGHGLLHTVE